MRRLLRPATGSRPPAYAVAPDHPAVHIGLYRFYLFTLKACAYLHLRLGDLTAGEAMLAKLIELDPADRLGGSVLRRVLGRMGQDDDE